MNKNSSNIIKEVLLAFAMGIIFLAVLIALSYIIFPNQMAEGENTEELLLIGFPMLIAYITYYARKILEEFFDDVLFILRPKSCKGYLHLGITCHRTKMLFHT